MKKAIYIIPVLLVILSTVFLTSESLWDDTAENLYNRKINYQVGDPVTIHVMEASALSYRSSSKSLKTFSASVSGGEITGIFDFLPQGSVDETKSSNMADDFSIEMTLQGSIQSITGNNAVISGSKSIQVNNKRSSLSISGTVPVSYIKDNAVSSTRIIDTSIQLTTLLDSDIDVITESDLVKIILNPEATSDIIDKTELREETRQQLLLQYFNSLLNVLFQ
jgi:flagellar basal body L-ring protein FlgH